MEILLTRYEIITDRGSGLTPGQWVETYWDDVSLEIKVYQKSSPSDLTPTLITSGPNLGVVGFSGNNPDTAIWIPTNRRGIGVRIDYSFCDSGDLNRFDWREPDFPYVKKIIDVDSFQCSQIVCDIKIESYSTTDASDAVTADGSITGVATSSNGIIRWGLDPNFDYSAGQLSGTFTSLVSGDYTLVAKDEVGCVDQINVTVGLPVNYGVKYKLEFTNVKGNDVKVEIEERGYEGDIIDVDGSDQAVSLRANADGNLNRFTRIIPTEFRLNLISYSNFFFQDLFTQDERKYKVKYYTDLGDGYELKWVGFVLGQNQSEAYLAPPYPIQIVATDVLADLKELDFNDSSGNKFKDDIITLRAVVEILKKTDLKLNIQFGINKYEQDMDNGVDDEPLNQCSFEPEVFYQDELKCDYVLDEILKPFGARIVQRNGKWWIYCIEQSVVSVPYREFDFNGVYITNGSTIDIKSIENPLTPDRISFRDGTQTLEIIPAYGIFFFDHILQRRESLVKSFSFEEEDIITNPSGLVIIDGWNVDISKDAGATSGIKEVKSFQGGWSFFYKRGTSNELSTTLNYVTVRSIGGEIEYSNEDSIQFAFDYAAILSRSIRKPAYYSRIQWSLKIGDYYYNEGTDEGWTNDPDYKYNDLYVKTYNDSQSFKKVILLRDVDELVVEDFLIEFVFHRQNSVDFIEDDETDHDLLKAIATEKRPYGSYAKGTITEVGTDRDIFTYILTSDIGNPDAIFPDDYDGADNKKVWILENMNRTRGTEASIEYWYLDNVVLLHLPGGLDPPKDNPFKLINNRNLKVDFEETFLLNDVDLAVNNSERTYRNFFKLLSGLPTQVWSRTWRSGEGKLLDLLISEYRSQYNVGTYKLTGALDIEQDVLPSTILSEEFDGGRKYMFMGYESDAFASSVIFDLSEIIDATDEGGSGVDAGFSTGFSLGFRS